MYHKTVQKIGRRREQKGFRLPLFVRFCFLYFKKRPLGSPRGRFCFIAYCLQMCFMGIEDCAYG